MRSCSVGISVFALVAFGCASGKPGSGSGADGRVEVKRCDDSWDLGRATYTAHWVTEKVIAITAQGEKPGPNYQVCLGESKIRIFPPQYELKWKSTGSGEAVMTPFKVEEKFNVARDQKSVAVNDHEGQHEIPIKDR